MVFNPFQSAQWLILSDMIRVFCLVAVIWLLLMPPLFTAGDCTREFEAENARIERDRAALHGASQAAAYWNGRGIAPRVMSVDQCRRAKPRDLPSCGSGPIVQASVPVRNLICKVYRDDEIRVRFFFDEHDRMERMSVDMKPFYSLPLAGGLVLHWAK
jgi:hypothetical protein